MPASDTVTREDAAHLLRRTGYGGSSAELTALTGKTRQECVDAAMGFTASDAIPDGPDVGHPSWVVNEQQWQVHSDVIDWWVTRMGTLPNPTATPSPAPASAGDLPIYERLAFFWHDHFACAQDKVGDIEAMWDQIRMFRRHAMGSFENLVRRTAVHPAMLVHLDNQHNTVWEPQENFGREIMELYTCGVGNFTEADVVAMTNAWTGHNTVGWDNVSEVWDSTYVYSTDAHDHGQKTLFGITANWNGIAQPGDERDVITELVHGVRQQATARRIAGKLFRWFAHEQPSESLVNELGNVFIAGNMTVAPVLRAILLHDEFWAASTRWSQIKSPTDFVVSVVKQLGIDAGQMGLRWRMENMGQVPLDPPSVAGWGGGIGWLSTASAWSRGSLARSLRWHATDDGVDGLGLLPGIEDMTAANAVQAIFDLFDLDNVSSQTRNRFEAWFTQAHATDRWSIPPVGFMLGMVAPENQVY
jgi:uncharacterized protein (DUF1800 family)